MKLIKKTLRLCALIVFMVLAIAGITIFGVAPTLNKDRKLFADIENIAEQNEQADPDNNGEENLKI